MKLHLCLLTTSSDRSLSVGNYLTQMVWQLDVQTFSQSQANLIPGAPLVQQPILEPGLTYHIVHLLEIWDLRRSLIPSLVAKTGKMSNRGSVGHAGSTDLQRESMPKACRKNQRR